MAGSQVFETLELCANDGQRCLELVRSMPHEGALRLESFEQARQHLVVVDGKLVELITVFVDPNELVQVVFGDGLDGLVQVVDGTEYLTNVEVGGHGNERG